MTERFKYGETVRWGAQHFDQLAVVEASNYTADSSTIPHYVLKDENGNLFVRREDHLRPKTTLPEYVAAYIKHELRYISLLQNPDILDTWIANAFEAYEGGAR